MGRRRFPRWHYFLLPGIGVGGRTAPKALPDTGAILPQYTLITRPLKVNNQQYDKDLAHEDGGKVAEKRRRQ